MKSANMAMVWPVTRQQLTDLAAAGSVSNSDPDLPTERVVYCGGVYGAGPAARAAVPVTAQVGERIYTCPMPDSSSRAEVWEIVTVGTEDLEESGPWSPRSMCRIATVRRIYSGTNWVDRRTGRQPVMA
jgi:hypothetical protein